MGTQTFKHVESVEANSYLLVNNANADEAFIEQVTQMLTNAYQDLEDLLGS